MTDKTARLIIDVQEAFIHQMTLANPNVEFVMIPDTQTVLAQSK